MTLVVFSPESLDELALRMLDLAANVRSMSHTSREHDVAGFQLHGNKVHEWLSHLEDWAHDGAGRLSATLLKQQGARRSKSLSTAIQQAAAKRGRKKKSG